ncbi:acyltransferase [Pseudomonas sp. BN411]|uniref:acyltransferase family protein n=1 Tax=Pseudomonas sp. BN411 TaxID=2567887 RepID=UPI002458332B|nr:acyltransferase [Pseudomonas sp. BN411]MDH4564485.1 acyltransferase [Pseudomonas sp. BN411]
MLNSIQTLRAIAAWIVVLHHYVLIFGKINSNSLTAILGKHGSIGVDIFFIISGIVIYLSTAGKSIRPGDFAMQRIARVVPAYWFYTAITAVTIVTIPSVMPRLGYDHTFLVKSLLFIPSQNPSGLGLYPILSVGWTLNLEMVFYAIFSLSLFLPRKLLVPAIFLGVSALQILSASHFGGGCFYAKKAVYEFLFGIVIAIIYQRGYLNHIPALAAASLIALSIYYITEQIPGSHDPITYGLPSAALVCAILSQERLFHKTRLLNKLGDWSYSTYLIHPIVIFYVLSGKKIGLFGDEVALLLVLAITLAASIASHMYLELPAQRMYKRWAVVRARATQTEMVR